MMCIKYPSPSLPTGSVRGLDPTSITQHLALSFHRSCTSRNSGPRICGVITECCHPIEKSHVITMHHDEGPKQDEAGGPGGERRRWWGWMETKAGWLAGWRLSL